MPFPTFATEGGTANAVIAPNLPQFSRGINVLFEVDFFDDAPSNTTPAVPGNPAMYPAFTIVDPSGTQVTSGVGQPGSTAGRWQINWSVPPSAALSTQSNKWLIVWNMVTSTGRQLQRTNPFDVIELRTPDTLEDLRSHSYLVYAGQSERLVIRFPTRPSELTIQGFPMAGGLSSPVPSTTAAFAGSLADSSIREVQEQNLFSYIFDTPLLTTLGDYQIVWNARPTLTSPNTTVVQRMCVPPGVFWSLAPSLKILIDKLQKKKGTIHAYDDADVYDYFQRGVGILNGVTPVSAWDLTTFPYTAFTVRFLIEAAALWAIQAQHLVAGELQFSFSGQTITLDLDQTGVYGEIVDKLKDDIGGDGKQSWPAAKVGLIRVLGPIAHVGNRLMGRYTRNQYTYKVDSGFIGSGSPSLFNGQFPGPGVNVGFTLTDVLVFLNLV